MCVISSKLTWAYLRDLIAVPNIRQRCQERENETTVHNTVEHTSVKPKFIGGEDAATHTTALKGDLNNSTHLEAGSRLYYVIHNALAYPFMISDNALKFDNPENVKTR